MVAKVFVAIQKNTLHYHIIIGGMNMFIVSEANPSGYSAMQTKTNNICDIYDIVLNITGDEKEAKWTTETASDMGFGGQYERKMYKI